MTFTLVLSLSLALLALATMQSCYVYSYCRFLKKPFGTIKDSARHTPFDESHSAGTDVAVVLCLRGVDPELPNCLAGILKQRYRDFNLHIVVDSEADPAVEFVERFFADKKFQPHLHVIQHIGEQRSLKCSALLEALQQIPPHIKIIAFIDADIAPDPNWLADLVAPLDCVEVGATTGNRWFSPNTATLGGYIRKLWNAAAIVQMEIYNIAWGGTLAIKRSVIEQCQLPEIWRNSFCEDTLLTTTLAKHDYKLVRVPNLISVNAESTSVAASFWWIVRQLITIRLYHPSWPLVKLHGLATSVGGVFALLGLVIVALSGSQRELYTLLAVLIVFQAWNLSLLIVVERANLAIVDSRETNQRKTTQKAAWPMQILAFLLIQLIQPIACIFAGRARHVRWREIKYEIDKQEVLLMEYLPYNETKSYGIESGTDSIS